MRKCQLLCCKPGCEKVPDYEAGAPITIPVGFEGHTDQLMDYTHACSDHLEELTYSHYVIRELEDEEGYDSTLQARLVSS